MTVAVSKALEDGARGGHLRLDRQHRRLGRGLRGACRDSVPLVLVAEGAIAGGKLVQTRALGARVLEVRGIVRRRRSTAGTRARGARRLRARQLAQPVPRRGAEDGRVRDRRGARQRARRVRDPLRRRRQHRPRTREASTELGLRHAGLLDRADRPPANARDARSGSQSPPTGRAVAASGAHVHAVDDEEITDAWLELAREEGLFCEPASAAGLAFLRGSGRASRRRASSSRSPGHGLKDPAAADTPRAARPIGVDPDPDAIAEAAG